MSNVRTLLSNVKMSEKQIRTVVWEEYARKQAEGKEPSQTRIFFNAIPKPLKNRFSSSTQRILEIGMGNGDYIGKTIGSTGRECIGYDYAENAVSTAASNGIQARLINLKEINEKNQLAYLDTLKADLSVAADILVIRVLEYLGPEAVTLLIFALLDAAKPGSTLYFETYAVCDKKNSLPNFICNEIENGYVASFFAPRTDIKFLHHTINDEGVNISSGEVEGTNNRLVVTKLK